MSDKAFMIAMTVIWLIGTVLAVSVKQGIIDTSSKVFMIAIITMWLIGIGCVDWR